MHTRPPRVGPPAFPPRFGLAPPHPNPRPLPSRLHAPRYVGAEREARIHRATCTAARKLCNATLAPAVTQLRAPAHEFGIKSEQRRKPARPGSAGHSP